MKKLLLILLLVTSIFLVSGCSKDKEDKIKIKSIQIDGLEKNEIYADKDMVIDIILEIKDVAVVSIGVVAENGEITILNNQIKYKLSSEYTEDKIFINVKDSEGNEFNFEKELKVIPKKDLTFILYLGGDNNLNYLGYLDLLEISRANINLNNINVVIFTDFYNETDELRGYMIKTNNEDDKIKLNRKIYDENNEVYEEINHIKLVKGTVENNSGHWETMLEVLNFVEANYPANQYILDIWNHGDGWYNDYSYTNPFKTEPRAIVGDDTSGGDDLSLWEIEYAISKSNIGKVDMIYMDACLMGGVEVAYQLKDVSDYIFFSPELTPGMGSEYISMLEAVDQNYKTSMLDVCKAISAGNLLSYGIGGLQYDGSNLEALVYTVIDQRKTDVFIQKLNSVSEKLIANIETIKKMGVWDILTYNAENVNDYTVTTTYVDIGSFLENVKAQNVSEDLKTDIDDFLNYMKDRNEYVVDLRYQNGVYPGYPMAYQEGSYGLSVYVPLKGVYTNASLSYYYNASRFAQDTKWYDFLTEYDK